MTQKCPGRTSGWFKCVILMQPWRSQDQHGERPRFCSPANRCSSQFSRFCHSGSKAGSAELLWPGNTSAAPRRFGSALLGKPQVTIRGIEVAPPRGVARIRRGQARGDPERDLKLVDSLRHPALLRQHISDTIMGEREVSLRCSVRRSRRRLLANCQGSSICSRQPAIDFAQPNVANPVQRHREIALEQCVPEIDGGELVGDREQAEGPRAASTFFCLISTRPTFAWLNERSR